MVFLDPQAASRPSVPTGVWSLGVEFGLRPNLDTDERHVVNGQIVRTQRIER
jgi:hypothetical protein